MRNYKFSGNFLYYVRLIKRLQENMLKQAASSCGLDFPEADVLSFLRENPGFDTARDVAVYRGVSKGYVSKAVETLVKEGFLEVRPDKSDRRMQHLVIAEKAKKAAEALHDAQINFYAAVTAGLSDVELHGMLSAIEKCAANVQSAVENI